MKKLQITVGYGKNADGHAPGAQYLKAQLEQVLRSVYCASYVAGRGAWDGHVEENGVFSFTFEDDTHGLQHAIAFGRIVCDFAALLGQDCVFCEMFGDTYASVVVAPYEGVWGHGLFGEEC